MFLRIIYLRYVSLQNIGKRQQQLHAYKVTSNSVEPKKKKIMQSDSVLIQEGSSYGIRFDKHPYYITRYIMIHDWR